MLDFNFSEMAVVALVALVVIGPKDLPKALRVIGYWVGKARGVARQFRAGFDEMVREAELAEMEKKWQAENERIMREHPALSPSAIAPALPDADPAPDADQAPHDDHAAPVMVETPVVAPAQLPAEPQQPDKAAS
ncbi:twin-arginine translocase subunit TatB [Sphingomonas sp. NBWT7]|uniref:Sec-independent protein translocase protein TatB n=1 Tax=Sphingomonas sp. NBWT7 TaxID=2596913 RepID=UPI001625662C|nr:Sec-independent protein translocase protein TatB [Sphingomonas sp. NBWT7]QNE30535.1 twin-arginine translocase subunit TatB [Sphingomonas sp. NBWT7]